MALGEHLRDAVDAGQADHLVLGEAGVFGAVRARPTDGRRGQDHLRAGRGQLLGDVLGGRQRGHGRDGGVGAQDAVVGDGEGGGVRAVQRDDVALADAPVRQRPGERLDHRLQLGVRRRCTGVDEGDLVGELRGDVAEYVVEDGLVRDDGVGPRAGLRHVFLHVCVSDPGSIRTVRRVCWITSGLDVR